jgi:Putative binding domain, N-terminal
MRITSSASARKSSSTLFSFFACCLFAGAVAASAQTVPLPYRPITAEYSYGLDRIIFVTAGPKQLHIFDPISQSDTAVNLSQAPLSLSVSPDGLHAAVGHNSLVSYVNLQTASVDATYPSNLSANGVILAADYVYILNPQGGGTIAVALSSGATTTFSYYSGTTAGRLHPSGKAFYEANFGSLSDFNISTGPISTVYTGNFLGSGPVCGGVWFSPDGRRVYSGCATVFQASPQDTVTQGCCNLTLDTNADILYWTTLAGPTQIVSLNESAVLGQVAAIPLASQYATPAINDNQVFLYDSAYFDPAGTFQLPDFIANGQNYQAHGRQIFYNQASTSLYVVMQADGASGLLDDFAVQVFPLSNRPVCGIAVTGPSSTAPATGTVATASITAAAACSYQATSDSSWIQFVSGAYGSGNGTLTYVVRPNSGDARSGIVTVGSQSFAVSQAAATASPANLTQLGYSVLAADYSKALDRMILLVKNAKELHIYDPAGGSDQIVPLPKIPLFLSVSPDGLSAAVGHDGWVSIVNLSTGSVASTTQIFGEAQTLLLAGNGYLYAYEANADYALISLQTATGAITFNGSYFDGRYPRLYADGNSFYTEESKWDISSGIPQSITQDYSGCAPFWLTEDGARMITSCGRIFTTSPALSLDLQPQGSFSNIPISPYYGSLPIQWAVESENLHSTAVIAAANNNYGGTGKEDTSVQIYGDQSLAYSGDLSLPTFAVGQTDYPGRGRYAFWNSAEDKLIVLEQADSSSGLLADYGDVVYSMAVPAPGCTFTLGTSSETLGAPPGQSIVGVGTAPGCIWAAASNTSWITVNSGGAGFGPGNLAFAVAPNAGSTARTGTLTIAGQTFTVTQSPASSTTTATSFLITAPATAVVGSPVAFTVTALDDGGQAIPSYSGEVHFTTTDGTATPPGNATLNGSGKFSISLLTAGTQTITVNDVTSPSITGTSGNIVVTPASGSLYVPMAPCRVADTRNSPGPFGGPLVSASVTRSFVIPNSPDCAIPSTATAYSMNLTVVPRGTLGYVTIWPAGDSQPLASTLNSIDGRIKANASIVPAGSGGAISVFATDDADVILDISGYFVPASASSALAFYPMPTCRLVDTRPGAPYTVSSGAVSGGTSRTLALLENTNCYISSLAQAYSLNITAVPSSGTLGYITVSPTGVNRPVVSTLNSPTGTTVANAAIVPGGTAGSVDVFATDTTDLVVDINGYFAPQTYAQGFSFYTLPPCRVLDTRNPSGSPPFSGTINVDVIASGCGGTGSTQAYVFNATVVPSASLGYLTLWPQGFAQPLASTENSLDGAIDSNMGIVPVAYNTGQISAFASDNTYLILDTTGYFAP